MAVNWGLAANGGNFLQQLAAGMEDVRRQEMQQLQQQSILQQLTNAQDDRTFRRDEAQRNQRNLDRTHQLQVDAFNRKEDPEKVRLAKAAGLTPGTPEWQRFLVGNEVKAPSGYQWVDPTNPNAGLSPIPNGPATHVSSELAGKIALMDAVTPGVQRARQVFLQPWGVKGVAQNVAANVPYVGDVAFLSGDVGIANRDVKTAVETALRVMTGAAAPEAEVTRYAAMFTPSSRDTEQSAKQKLDNLEAFMANAKKIALQGRVPVIPQSPAPQRGPQQAQQFQEGQTATGPGGQRIQFRNGQWVPLQQ